MLELKSCCLRKLEDGDIINVDVTVYYKGVHGKNLLVYIIPMPHSEALYLMKD